MTQDQTFLVPVAVHDVRQTAFAKWKRLAHKKVDQVPLAVLAAVVRLRLPAMSFHQFHPFPLPAQAHRENRLARLSLRERTNLSIDPELEELCLLADPKKPRTVGY